MAGSCGACLRVAENSMGDRMRFAGSRPITNPGSMGTTAHKTCQGWLKMGSLMRASLSNFTASYPKAIKEGRISTVLHPLSTMGGEHERTTQDDPQQGTGPMVLTPVLGAALVVG